MEDLLEHVRKEHGDFHHYRKVVAMSREAVKARFQHIKDKMQKQKLGKKNASLKEG